MNDLEIAFWHFFSVAFAFTHFSNRLSGIFSQIISILLTLLILLTTTLKRVDERDVDPDPLDRGGGPRVRPADGGGGDRRGLFPFLLLMK